MHQVSLKKICPLEAFQLLYCPDNDAKNMVKHFIFLQKFCVICVKAKVIDPFGAVALLPPQLQPQPTKAGHGYRWVEGVKDE